MSSPPESPSADHSLPPVKAPTGGFLLQLFVVPGIIVGLMVLGWLLVQRVVGGDSDPRQEIAKLQRSGPKRWQVAFNLANLMRQEGNEDFKRDHESAQQVADILSAEIERGSMEENPIALRIYLSSILGEFYVADGADALLEAATTQRSEKEVDVRRHAISSLALLINNLRKHGELSPSVVERVTPVMFDAADDRLPLIRSSAAYALGVLGTKQAIEELEALSEDINADVRYNAALGLARYGNEAAIPVLAEMLDLQETAGMKLEKEASMKQYKRALIMINGARAVSQLAVANPSADLQSLEEALEILKDADIERKIRQAAREALIELRQPDAA